MTCVIHMFGQGQGKVDFSTGYSPCDSRYMHLFFYINRNSSPPGSTSSHEEYKIMRYEVPPHRDSLKSQDTVDNTNEKIYIETELVEGLKVNQI